MGMIEIAEKHRGGGFGRAIKDFKESLECLKEDFETLWDEIEEMGERDGREWDKEYNRDRERDDRYRDDEERMGERRGRRRRYR